MAERQAVSFVLRAVALAMGIAVVALSVLGTVDADAAVGLLGVGLAALAAASLESS